MASCCWNLSRDIGSRRKVRGSRIRVQTDPSHMVGRDSLQSDREKAPSSQGKDGGNGRKTKATSRLESGPMKQTRKGPEFVSFLQ